MFIPFDEIFVVEFDFEKFSRSSERIFSSFFFSITAYLILSTTNIPKYFNFSFLQVF